MTCTIDAVEWEWQPGMACWTNDRGEARTTQEMETANGKPHDLYEYSEARHGCAFWKCGLCGATFTHHYEAEPNIRIALTQAGLSERCVGRVTP